MAVGSAKKPVQLSISEKRWKEMTDLAGRLGVTRSELVGDSFDVYKFLVDYKEKGWEILLKKGADTVQLARV